jgi:hypothetical protein
MKFYNLLVIATLITSLQAGYFLRYFESNNNFQYENSCIDKCFDDEENYFKCLLLTAAKSLYYKEYKNKIENGEMPKFEKLELDQLLSLIKQNKEVIKKLVIEYNKKDIVAQDPSDEQCNVINESNLTDFLNSF